MLLSDKTKGKPTDNIELLVTIGTYKLALSVPRETTIGSVINIVRGYEQIHREYGPLNCTFVGLASAMGNPIIDHCMTQPALDFMRFRKRLELKGLYVQEQTISKLSANEFEFLKCLGKGACGEVYLVRSKITGYLFAMKRLPKSEIKDYSSMETIVREKVILTELEVNTHTVTCHASFQSADHFNFLMQYYPGGELFLHLTREARPTQEEAKIYFCQILAGMEFLHKNKVLYRDLKPQNILVDLNGHLHIADFGLSKWDFRQEDAATTLCGSSDYMAPQIIENKPYNFSADFYSIGAILYELLSGCPPYYSQHTDSVSRLELIRKMDLNLYELTKNGHLRNLLKALLHPDPDERLCDFQAIRESPWLSNVNWDNVVKKSGVLPLAPDVYSCYICEQFLVNDSQIDAMNKVQPEKSHGMLFQSLFNYVRPDSRQLVMGIDPEPSKQLIPKRKMAGYPSKEKLRIKPKTNISIALFEKQSSNSSVSSNFSIEPATRRNSDKEHNLFKKTKKSMVKNPSQLQMIGHSHQSHQISQGNFSNQSHLQSQSHLMTKQPSMAHILTKQPSTSQLLTSTTHVLNKQPSSANILKTTSQPTDTSLKTPSGSTVPIAAHYASCTRRKSGQLKENKDTYRDSHKDTHRDTTKQTHRESNYHNKDSHRQSKEQLKINRYNPLDWRSSHAQCSMGMEERRKKILQPISTSKSKDTSASYTYRDGRTSRSKDNKHTHNPMVKKEKNRKELLPTNSYKIKLI